MAIVRAVKTGVWSDTTAWNTGALPTSADDVYSNTFTVTIDVSPTVLSISNAAATGVSAGGGFVISANNITLTANVNQGSVTCLTLNTGTTNVVNITGNTTANSGGQACVIFNGTGTANIVGNVTSGNSNAGTYGMSVAGAGTVNITGIVSSGSFALGQPGMHGIHNASTGTVNVTGTVLSAGLSNSGAGINNNFTGTINVIGNVSAGTAAGIINASTGVVSVSGTVTSSNSAAGVASASATAQVTLTGPFNTSANGTNPVYALNWKWATTAPATYYQIRSANLAVIRPLYTADYVGGNPATSNVRSGTVYGPSNELTGTCAVPPAGSVALGVPVDNTTGTAAIDGASIRSALGLASANLDSQLDALPTAAEAASAVRSELATELGRIDATVSSRLAPGGTLARVTLADTVTTLTNAPDVPTEAEIATAVRTELSTELGRIDASTSSRLAAVAYTAPPSVGDIAAAVWAAATRTLTTAFDSSTTIAAAVWSAATRTLTSSSAPSAADNAAAVWGYSSGRTITGGTVDTLTNAPDVPTEAEIADAVRTELTPELARLSNAATTQEVGDIVEGALAD